VISLPLTLKPGSANAIDARIRPANERLEAIDALRGIAIATMSLQHVAFFMRGSFQAETYGGRPAQLMSWPYWISGLAVDLNAPTFWLLVGMSVPLMVSKHRRAGESEWAITLQMLKRVGVLALLDMTVCEWAWRIADPPVPYTHVLLSISLSLALLSVFRLLPTKILAAAVTAMVIVYQAILPTHVSAWSETDSAWIALLVGYRTAPWPALEFALLGWFPLVCVGFLLGSRDAAQLKRPVFWCAVSAALWSGWLLLRTTGVFGDLVRYSRGDDWYRFLIMNKTPIALTYVLFYWGLASLLLAGLMRAAPYSRRIPLSWLVALGRASLFAFVAHIGIYSVLTRLTRAVALPLPRVAITYVLFVVGMAILVPTSRYYIDWRSQRPKTVWLP